MEDIMGSIREQRISVCMAAYNGGKYIDAQLASILSQLGEIDEVVIVDDCSRDDTVERIRSFQDKRIRLLQHVTNLGVVATFEDALRHAGGEILFLSDDDDIWAPDKVRRFLEVFRDLPEVEIVTSKVQLIDETGKPFSNERLTRGGKFRAGFWANIYKNHYQGSAMALRASLLKRVLPFPTGSSFFHDVWIGTRSAITGGRTEFIDASLLMYRRHSANLSERLSMRNQFQVRADLLWAHTRYLLRFGRHGQRGCGAHTTLASSNVRISLEVVQCSAKDDPEHPSYKTKEESGHNQ